MTAFPDPSLPPAEALDLHQRLLQRDPVAPQQIAEALLTPLASWLAQTNPHAAEDRCLEAATEALVTLFKNPAAYRPEKAHLEVYLRLSARGDLLNLLRKERRHSRGRVPLDAVAHSRQAGKYLGKDDDPAISAQLDEEHRRAASVAPAVCAGLEARELRVLDLLLQGERRTAVLARAFGIDDRPTAEQRKVIKQVKDKLRARRRRAEGRAP
jgi:RNA polymerase sigma-70 factor (ECF subfamily)